VQQALGDTKEAKRLLASAWTIYERLGIRWRAARAALALAQIDDEEVWTQRAQEALRFYPRSWLRRTDRVAGVQQSAAPDSDAVLTAAQQTVLDLLVQGLGTEQIAKHLKRSTFTVRNHIKAIFKAYGVNSRAALIVRTRGA